MAEGEKEPEAVITKTESAPTGADETIAPRGVLPESGNESAEFLKHLQDEKLKTQAARSSYVTQKLAYATGLLALGSLRSGSADLSLLLYLVPFLSIVFDLYILGEDYSVKRIGAFLGAASTDDLEKRWEHYVSDNRDPFAPLAIPILTTLLAVATWFALSLQPSNSPVNIVSWLPYAVPLLAIAATWSTFFLYKKMKKVANKNADKSVKGRGKR